MGDSCLGVVVQGGIIQGKIFGSKIPGFSCPGENFMRVSCPGVEVKYLGVIVRKGKVRGVIVLGGIS